MLVEIEKLPILFLFAQEIFLQMQPKSRHSSSTNFKLLILCNTIWKM